jgi:hypothetical protein
MSPIALFSFFSFPYPFPPATDRHLYCRTSFFSATTENTQLELTAPTQRSNSELHPNLNLWLTEVRHQFHLHQRKPASSSPILFLSANLNPWRMHLWLVASRPITMPVPVRRLVDLSASSNYRSANGLGEGFIMRWDWIWYRRVNQVHSFITVSSGGE